MNKFIAFFLVSSCAGFCTLAANIHDDFTHSKKSTTKQFLQSKITKAASNARLSSLKTRKSIKNKKRRLGTSDQDNADYIRKYLQGIALYVWDQDEKNGTKYLKGNAFKLIKPDAVSKKSAKSGAKTRFQRNFQPLLNLSGQSSNLVGQDGTNNTLSNVVSSASTVSAPKYTALSNLLSSETFGSTNVVTNTTNNTTTENPFDAIAGSMFGSDGLIEKMFGSSGLMAPGGMFSAGGMFAPGGGISAPGGGMGDPSGLGILLNIATQLATAGVTSNSTINTVTLSANDAAALTVAIQSSGGSAAIPAGKLLIIS